MPAALLLLQLPLRLQLQLKELPCVHAWPIVDPTLAPGT